MPRRVLIAVLQQVSWHPPGIDAATWRAALAEDIVDLIATLEAVDGAIAVPATDHRLAASVAWPGMPVYDVPTTSFADVLAAATADGYEQAALLAPDAPDLPGLLIGKLLRPLTTRSVAVAPAADGDGLLGLACRLPAPAWLPDGNLDAASAAALRAASPRAGEVAVTPAWRRIRGPEGLATLDPAIEGWETTRALLSAPA